MKITDLIDKLNTIREQHGDLDVVTGCALTGYGNEITDLTVTESKDVNDNDLTVVDLEMSDESLVADGGF